MSKYIPWILVIFFVGVIIFTGLFYFPGKLSEISRKLSNANKIIKKSEITIAELIKSGEDKQKIIDSVYKELQKAYKNTENLEKADNEYGETNTEFESVVKEGSETIAELIRIELEFEKAIKNYKQIIEEIKKQNFD